MRDRDRFWWLIFVIGLVLCAGAAAAAAPYVYARTTPTNDPNMTSTDYWQLVVVGGSITLLCLMLGVLLVAMALHARKQHRRRLAAFRGDESALRLAEIHPDPALAPDVSATPLELMWRLGPAAKVVYALLTAVSIVVWLVAGGLSLSELVAPVVLFPQSSPEDLPFHTHLPPMSLTDIILRAGAACGVIAVSAGIVVVLVRLMPYLFGRPFGLTITGPGIEARTELGSRIHMTWDEMRLLEVATESSGWKRRFSLYSLGKRLEWTDYSTCLGAGYVPVGATMSEMTLRQAALLGLIVARTGLVPRTLAAKAWERTPAPNRDMGRSTAVVVLLVAALFTSGVAAADFLFPLTPFTWANWASAVSPALLTLGLLVASLRVALTRSTLPAGAKPPSVGAPPLDAPTVAYTFSSRTPVIERLMAVLIGVWMAIDLFPGAWALVQQFAFMLPISHPRILSEGPFIFISHLTLGCILVMFGLIGMALLYTAAIWAADYVRADRDGLTTDRGRGERLIAWSSVQDVSWGPDIWGKLTYVVEIDALTGQISWPAGLQAAEAIPPSDDSLPIGPDELAALVAARIGKPIRVRGG